MRICDNPMDAPFDRNEWIFDGMCSSMTINGMPVESEAEELIENWLHNRFAISVCPYCSNPVRNPQVIEEPEDDEYYSGIHRLWCCLNCRYWQAEWSQHWSYDDCISVQRFVSKLREFDNVMPEGCLPELSQYIRANPSVLHTYNPTYFEHLVADVFKANWSNVEVTHVGRPDDGGVDVLLVDSGCREWLIQVKRRSKPHATESVGTVRNLLGAMSVRGGAFGIVVSSADHFSTQAYSAAALAKANDSKVVRLVDKQMLLRLIGSTLPNQPWYHALKYERGWPLDLVGSYRIKKEKDLFALNYLKMAFSHASAKAIQYYAEIRAFYRKKRRSKGEAQARTLVAKELARIVYQVLTKQESFNGRFKGKRLSRVKAQQWPLLPSPCRITEAG